ncbi:unnamed protein product, partial [Mesorhabditis spiculigera]
MHHRHLSTGYPPRNVFNGVSSGLLLVLVSALLISSVAATQIRSTNNSQLVGIDRQPRDGGITCPEFRPFVCYVYEELGQDYPAWLKKVGDDSDADKMKADQKAIVQADELLDCDKNPFYKELGNESLTVTKLQLCTEVDPNQKFCLSTEDDDKTLMVIIVVAVVGTVLLIVGAVGLWLWVRSRRQKREKKEPVNSPKSQGTKNNSGEDEKSAE